MSTNVNACRILNTLETYHGLVLVFIREFIRDCVHRHHGNMHSASCNIMYSCPNKV